MGAAGRRRKGARGTKLRKKGKKVGLRQILFGDHKSTAHREGDWVHGSLENLLGAQEHKFHLELIAHQNKWEAHERALRAEVAHHAEKENKYREKFQEEAHKYMIAQKQYKDYRTAYTMAEKDIEKQKLEFTALERKAAKEKEDYEYMLDRANTINMEAHANEQKNAEIMGLQLKDTLEELNIRKQQIGRLETTVNELDFATRFAQEQAEKSELKVQKLKMKLEEFMPAYEMDVDEGGPQNRGVQTEPEGDISQPRTRASSSVTDPSYTANPLGMALVALEEDNRSRGTRASRIPVGTRKRRHNYEDETRSLASMEHKKRQDLLQLNYNP